LTDKNEYQKYLINKNLNNVNKNLIYKNSHNKLKIHHKNPNNKISKNNPKLPIQKLTYYTGGTKIIQILSVGQ